MPVGANGTPDGFAAELEGALHVKEQEQIIAEVGVAMRRKLWAVSAPWRATAWCSCASMAGARRVLMGTACDLTDLALRAPCSAKRTARASWTSSTWMSCQCPPSISRVICLMRGNALPGVAPWRLA